MLRFLDLRVWHTICRFSERCRDGQYSLVTFSFFQIFCSSTFGAHRAQSFVKVGARVPVPYGVDATFVGQFHTKKHDKTAIKS